jgi:hypothetical protein
MSTVTIGVAFVREESNSFDSLHDWRTSSLAYKQSPCGYPTQHLSAQIERDAVIACAESRQLCLP